MNVSQQSFSWLGRFFVVTSQFEFWGATPTWRFLKVIGGKRESPTKKIDFFGLAKRTIKHKKIYNLRDFFFFFLIKDYERLIFCLNILLSKKR